jgi:2',3'-cyclic-nucleotide 2'-phosphodiesterase (5'-nucleotidase family)
VTLVGLNDVYRIGAEPGEAGGLARLRTLRAELEEEAPDLLMLHGGDLLSPSLLSRIFFGAQMIDILNRLDGDGEGFDERMFITFGNHEFDRGSRADAGMLESRIRESQFRWLKSNIVFGQDEDGEPLVQGENLGDRWLVASGGVQVGLFGVTIDSQQAEYLEPFLDPVETARQQTAALRREGAELVIGLTHLTAEMDAHLLETLGDEGPDLIIGGHEHEQLVREVGWRRVIKADSDARTVSVVRVTLRLGAPPAITYRYADIGPEEPAEDPEVAEHVERWETWFDEQFCNSLEPPEPPGCVDTVLGHAGESLGAEGLEAEELAIRRLETNFGDWIADLALTAFADQGAQAAILNSGGLRLNQNIAAGNPFRRRELEGLLPFSSELILMRVPGSVLQEVIERSVEEWTGSGHFLQIAGFAYRHDPEAKTADGLTLLTAEGPRPVSPEEEILLVTTEFLADPGRGQDGYTMLRPEYIVDDTTRPRLRQLVEQGFAAAEPEGITPRREGRICTVGVRDDPCLAVVPR